MPKCERCDKSVKTLFMGMCEECWKEDDKRRQDALLHEDTVEEEEVEEEEVSEQRESGMKAIVVSDELHEQLLTVVQVHIAAGVNKAVWEELAVAVVFAQKGVVLPLPEEPDDGLIWWKSLYMHCWPAFVRMPADEKNCDFAPATREEIAAAASLGMLPVIKEDKDNG